MIDDKILYKEIVDMIPNNEVISKQTRIQTLNVLKSKLDSLYLQTTSDNTRAVISSQLAILNDCYKIDMYKFQFKAVINILQKDIKNIEESILLEVL
jgi:hypothetical protein